MPFATTWTDLSQREKDKYHMVSLICGILKKMIQMNLFTKQKQPTDIENKLMVTKGKRAGRMIN